MSIRDELIRNKEQLLVLGLGYVGLPIAVSFAKKGVKVIGFDINKKKIDNYKRGIDETHELGKEVVQNNIEYTSNKADISRAKVIIVAVPTPVNTDHTPDLMPIINATELIGERLNRESIVVYESTVYPGCTEDVCIPLLEKMSGMKCGEDFWVGYSPERINPGDKKHRVDNIKKIVSGVDEYSLTEIKEIYDLAIEVGTHSVSSIKTAEAIKVVENSQRDINIAFMNELAMVFDRMGIDTNEVVDGMNTKWNALGFRPGLVGGHCIGVDPFYFTYEAERLGYHSQIILNGRIVNDQMATFVAEKTIKKMIEAEQVPKRSKIMICGMTFKENCVDVRNSKVFDIIKCLRSYGIEPIVEDPYADRLDTLGTYNVDLVDLNNANNLDCIIIAVAHDAYRKMKISELISHFKNGNSSKSVLIDVKGVFDVADLKKTKLTWWRL